MYWQLIMTIGVWLFGLIFAIIQSGSKYIFHPLAVSGGVIWSFGNLMTVPVPIFKILAELQDANIKINNINGNDVDMNQNNNNNNENQELGIIENNKIGFSLNNINKLYKTITNEDLNTKLDECSIEKHINFIEFNQNSLGLPDIKLRIINELKSQAVSL